jgi:hypothetical protein
MGFTPSSDNFAAVHPEVFLNSVFETKLVTKTGAV